MTLLGLLGGVRIRIQVDVGIGDAVTPAPRRIEYPCLLGLPPPKLRAYRPETSIAEKFHAMVVLGGANSRMKDFFDIYVLASRLEFDGEGLAAAISLAKNDVSQFDRRASAARVIEALQSANSASIRINYLMHWTRQRIGKIAELRGQPVSSYHSSY